MNDLNWFEKKTLRLLGWLFYGLCGIFTVQAVVTIVRGDPTDTRWWVGYIILMSVVGAVGRFMHAIAKQGRWPW